MFKRRPLQSKSEVWMRNIAMGFLIIYMMTVSYTHLTLPTT